MLKELPISSSASADSKNEADNVNRDAMLLELSDIHEPDGSITGFLANGRNLTKAARENFIALARVGVSMERICILEARLDALRNAQKNWNNECLQLLAKKNNSIIDEKGLDGVLSNNREMRNRIYTLAKESVQALQMFAAFAFSRDPNDDRRQQFGFAPGKNATLSPRKISPEKPRGIKKLFRPFA